MTLFVDIELATAIKARKREPMKRKVGMNRTGMKKS